MTVDMHQVEHLTHVIGTSILVGLYALRLWFLFRRRVSRDLASNPVGDVWKSIVASFFIIVTPWRMESTRRHWFHYAEFVAFHAGAFTNILTSFLITYAPKTFVAQIRYVLAAVIALGLLAGLVRLGRRIFMPEVRVISTFDDYFALFMVMAFGVTGIGAVLYQGEGWNLWLLVYFVIAGLFLVYEPFSKIRHYLYYPFTRYFFGNLYGRRGTF